MRDVGVGVDVDVGDAQGASKRARRKPAGPLHCQAPGCGVDLNEEKPYFKRHQICPAHMKGAPVVVEGGAKVCVCVR